MVSRASPLVMLLLAASRVAGTWVSSESTGFEYHLTGDSAGFDEAQAICAAFGDDATLASPTTSEANSLIFGLGPAGQPRFIGLTNTNRQSCDSSEATWTWESGAVYAERSDQWLPNEPNNFRCKERCVVVGSRRAELQTGQWNDAKCTGRNGVVCQRPFPIAIHEQQSVTLRQTCPSAKARDTEQCLNTEIAASCDVTTLAVRRNALRDGLIVTATVREANPDATMLKKNGATPMQSTCIEEIGAALDRCNSGCDAPMASFQQFTTCSDGFRNGLESGNDCGGNDCSACTANQLSNPSQSGGDPHFVARLGGGIDLCYDVHGTPGDVLNLVSGERILINSLVVGAPNTVAGTYHGAVGVVAMVADGSGRRDSLAMVADGTVRFNGALISTKQTKHRGAEMMVTVTDDTVMITMRSSNVSLELSVVHDATGGSHLDLAVTDQRGLNGTHGIIGQFVNADASVSPMDDEKSILTVNGKTINVVRRRMPQISGTHDQFCYKYMDLQATGALDGSVEDYVVGGIYESPSGALNALSAPELGGAEIDEYVASVAKSERDRLDQVLKEMHGALSAVGGAAPEGTAKDVLRNTLIERIDARFGVGVQALQSMPDKTLADRGYVLARSASL